ncbi:MAG: lamin tail domain-containing protein [Ardenticatenaceae bacterium]|nr:lamin tail domain-containing protein [Ardenticatenaceae bacterium]
MKRLVWVLISALLPLFVILLAIGQARATAVHAPFDVIINEWSQGNGGSKEWMELLVVNGPLDMRGWELDDGDAGGGLFFSSDMAWSSVPPGTLLVIYNASDPDTILPPDDTNLSDCTAVIPHNHAALFSGGWPALSNTDDTDNPHLLDDGAVTIHNFSLDPGTALHPAANQNAQYGQDTAVGVSSPLNWTNEAATAATPGVGNTITNSNWIASLCVPPVGEADLWAQKEGPATAVADSTITYTINLNNIGQATATNVVLTDTLPGGVSYLGDDSGFTLIQPDMRTLVWQVGEMVTNTAVSFQVTAQISTAVVGPITNYITATTTFTESNTSNNHSQVTTLVSSGEPPDVVLEMVLPDGYASADDDEAVALRNLGSSLVDLSNWELRDSGSGSTSLPPGTTLAPGERLWLTKANIAFRRQFGFSAGLEAVDSDPAVPNLVGTWPGFANAGDKVILLDETAVVRDVLIFGDEDTGQIGWGGTAVQPYQASTNFATEGQIFYRQRDQLTGLPVPDTNTAVDWAQSRADVINGRKVLYPGWDLDEFFFTKRVTETAVVRLAIAPDNAYETLVQQINTAQTSLEIETHTFENIAIADALIAAVNRGVAVTILLEGAPPGGLPDQQKYNCQRLEAAGGQCWFMFSDDSQDVFDRYRFIHAKFILIDGQRVAVSSENLSPNSLPSDDKSDGTWGRRGVVLITSAPTVVAHVQSIFERDFVPTEHVDLIRWAITDTNYGPPPVGFIPITVTGGISYEVRYPAPLVLNGQFAFEVVQSPENSLRDVDGLLGLIGRVGAGDELLVQQLEERPYWGDTNSNATDDPNPRLEAYIAAARRGATVRILLDEYFDEFDSPLSNKATCDYVEAVAYAERLRLSCARSNPTGLGIHNKMVLARIEGQGYIHIGSINGTEQSSKGNRELALQLQSNEAYDLLADMFERDWPHILHLPIIFNNYLGRAQYPLISEVLYDPPGLDDGEFIELVNPTSSAVDLSNYSVGDAVNPTDFEDVRRFPSGTILLPGQTLVIATSATAFQAEYGFAPDFEIVDTDAAVPDLIDDLNWGDPNALLQLGNLGDEVILRDGNDTAVDAIAYGTGSYPGITTCQLVSTSNISLERFPYWRDTNNCSVDFRQWPFPNPGALP